MQRFEYRQPRFPVDLPVQLSIAHETLAARCTDISTKGIRLNLTHTVVAGCYGTVSLRHQNQTIELKARVAHTGSEQSGLEFLYNSTVEQRAVAHLVASLKSPHHRPLMSLVPKLTASLGGPTTQY